MQKIIHFNVKNYTFMKNQKFWHIQNKKKNTISKNVSIPFSVNPSFEYCVFFLFPVMFILRRLLSFF